MPCGKAGPGIEITIADPDTGHLLDDGADGEILVRGPSVASGFWKDEKGTAAQCAFRPDGDRSSAPWLRTGDIGVLDKAVLTVKGRLKDILIVRGQNHYPEDIEASLAGSDERLVPGR